MEKNYRYAIRKTTLGVGSVAIAAFLAGQVQAVEAAENLDAAAITANQPAAPAADSEAAPTQPSSTGTEAPINEALNTAAPTAGANTTARDGVATTADGQVKTTAANSVAADEAKVGDYRNSDLANNGISANFIAEEVGTTKEGVTPTVLNPSPTSQDKRKFGIQIEIDRAKGERTYTGVYVTDNQRGAQVKPGNGEIVKPGQDADFKKVNYPRTPEEEAKIDAGVKFGRQVGIGISTGEEFLSDLNAIDNKNTTFAWKSEYTRDNPNTKMFTGENFGAGFSVNPYPNENKNLSIISVVGETNVAHVPVQGQYLKTGARIENLLPEDYTRITSEVYHPDGTVVDPNEAKALLVDSTNIENLRSELNKTLEKELKILNDNTQLSEKVRAEREEDIRTRYDGSTIKTGDIIFKMPQGALQDPNSIFNNPKFEGIQNLNVRFFARPRTADEFSAIVKEANDLQGYEDKFYVPTGAGTKVINHNGQAVTIDKQGIARYDHYNKVGEITVNLDDTRYYDQSFKDANGQNTEDHTSSAIKPGEPFEVNMFMPPENEKKANQKTPDQMKAAKVAGEAIGEVRHDFVKAENQKIADSKGKTVDELTEDEKWTVTHSSDDITKFTVKAPKDAKPGEFIAVPVTYTYTNGSQDIHWFHFVVQDDGNYRPEYHAETGFQGETLTKLPEPKPAKDAEKHDPVSYELVPGTYKDNVGNVWDNVTINSQTGEVTAVVPENADIKGGENIYIPVKVNYANGATAEIKAQFIARPTNIAQGGHAVVEEIPFETHVVYDDTLDAGVVKKTDGELGSKRTVYEWNYDNRRRANRDGRMVEQPVMTKVQETIIKPKKDAEIRIGVKPVQTGLDIPMTTEYILDPSLQPGQDEMVEEGQDGYVLITSTRNPETGAISLKKTIDTPMMPRKIKIASYEHSNDIPYETRLEFDNSLPAGSKQVVQEGIVGKTQSKYTPARLIDSAPLRDYLDNVNVETEGGSYLPGGIPNYDKIANYLVAQGYWDRDLYTKGVDEYGDMTSFYAGVPLYNFIYMDAKNHLSGDILLPSTVSTKPVKPKQDQVIKVGTKTTGTLVDTDDIPFNYTVEFDPNFYTNYPDATENYKVVTPGQAGSNKKTWTIENSKIVGEPVVETVAPVNAVIKVGQKDYNGSFETVDKDPVPFETEYIVDNSLNPGAEVVEKPGGLGEKTTTTTHTIKNGQVTASTPGQSVQTKAPIKRVVRIGAKTNGTHQVTEAIPFQVEVKKDPSVKEGEYKIETPGKAGSQTKTLTIENSQVTATSEPTIDEQATNAVVLVGDQDFTGEVSHDVTEKVPFPVKVLEDPSLDKGTYHVDQEGVPGTKTTTYTQAIKNGAADGALTSDVKGETPAKEHIIRVGTKPLAGSTNVTTSNQKPFDVEIEYDNTKPAGTVEVVPNTGIPGEETKTTPVTAQDGTVTAGETSTTETKAPINKKIIVGTQGYNGEFSHEYTNVLPFETEVEVDPSLAPNEVVEVQKGQLGETTTKVSQSITNGVPGEKVVSDPVQTKAPVNRKIKVGAKTEGVHTYTEELPFSYTVEYDPAIEAGKYEIVTPGAVGSRTTEWPITNSVVGEGKLTQETPASNALIKVGNKDFTGQVTHTETVPVPNTVEIRYNPNVKAGETKVLEEGKPGSVDVTYTQGIRNGQADGELKKTEANRLEPVNRVIEVGTQPVSGTETPIQQDVPVEVEYLYDNTKDKGFVEAGQVTPGKTESKVVSKLVDGQVVNTVENVVTPAKQQIIVGTKDYTGEFKHTEQSIAPYRTIYKLDPTLKHGQEVVDQEGQFGLIQRQVSQDFVNGKLGEKTYSPTEEVMKPQDRIVRIGSMTDGSHTSTEEIPFAVKVEVDPNLPKGDYQVVTPGEPGTKETTITIENSQVVGTPSSKLTKEPVTQVIKVGDQDFTGEVSHNVTEALPFKVEIQEDPNLPLFEIQEVQKGENGSKTTKYSQAIKNGAADGQLKTEEIARTEPKTHIIKVGTKAPENAESRVKEVPAEIEYVYDNTKDKGVVEKGAYTPGKVESKIKNVFNPQTGQIETTTEEVVIPAKQVIVVGTKDYTGEFKHTEQSLAPFKTEYKLDPSLKPGQEVVEQEGKLGLIERDVSQKYVNGTMADKVFGQTREVIAPENRIVRIGAKTDGSHISTEEIPFDVKVEVDPSLPKGDYQVLTPGQPGTKETTVTIENSQIVGQPVSKVTKEPVTQVIKVGNQDFTGQVNHTERFEVPYKVEVRENPNLKAGETKLVQEGQPGSYDVTYTQAIKNGQADGQLERAISNPVEPKAHILEVGTQPVAGTETAINKEIPVEIEYVFDDSLEKGQVQTGQLTPGKSETRVVSKVVDGQVVNTEETVVTPAKHIVRVGSKDFTGDYKFSNTCPVPFPVEIRQNPDLTVGTSKTVQEGVPGSKTTDYTQAIKNGQADGAPVSQDGAYTAPKAHIIEVGTKPVQGNSHESNKDVPVETIFEYDPSLDKGKLETVQVVPGHVTSQIVNKVVDGKVVTEEVPLVTPAKHIVKVGTKGYDGQFNHESIHETPFATEVIYDDQLDSGKVEEVQAGQPGQVKETVTQVIVNGVLQDKQVNQEVLREPQKRILRVGIKQLIKEVPVEKIVEVVKEVPVEKVVEVVKEVPVEVIKEVPVEVIKEVPVEKIVEIVKEVPVEKVVEVVKEVPVEVIKEVPVEVIREVPVEIIKDCLGIEVVYNKDLKPGQVKVVDPGEKRISEIRDGKTVVKQEGRKMIVEVGCAKTDKPAVIPHNPEGDKDQSKDPQDPQGDKDQSKDPQDPQGGKDQSTDPKEPESGHKDPQSDEKEPEAGKDPQGSDKDKLPSKDPQNGDQDKLKDKDHAISKDPESGHKDPSSADKVPSFEERRQDTKPEAVKLNTDQVKVLKGSSPESGQAKAYTPLTQLPATGAEASANRFHPAVLTLVLGLGLLTFSTKKKKA
ncbi:G5 domain-containing protein [Aerococcus sp. UMB7834]|uniref:G5 domain-containing protein n=1 Tax=Aerococcus sp. UMB7834 TaxID=3046342 RepID=UPI00254D2B93|nr:G5 domain-containing protein [Aerococcus sp. UMB7834]MDK6805446.1 G5 domain-containing protein [Aerococcus sp. UMB7834]